MKRTLTLLTAIALLLTLFSACSRAEMKLPAVELIDLGEKYLLNLEYEEALVQFLQVIEIEPMNPRGYTGAAEAYVGLGQLDEAIAILEQGLPALPDNADIKGELERLSSMAETISPSESEALSLSEIAEQEPWKLFNNSLTEDQILFAGVPFWECSFDIVQEYYPGGLLTFKDAEGRIVDADGNQYEGYLGWDKNYSTMEIQYAEKGNEKYAGFGNNVAAIRDLSLGMELDKALALVGFSSDGIAYVEKYGSGFTFWMDETGCLSVSASETAYPSYDFSLVFHYNTPTNENLNYNICFRDGVIALLEIALSPPV